MEKRSLQGVEIEPEFAQWALKMLKKEHRKEIKERGKLCTAEARNIDKIQNSLDRLLDLRIAEEITEEEYKNKKGFSAIFIEKKKEIPNKSGKKSC